MIIARKLLIPTLAIFLAILVALGVFFAIDYSQGVAAQARRDLDGLEQALQSDLQSRAALASALAASNANSQNVQAAFAASDRQRLLDLTLPAYRALSGAYQFSTQQFVSRPASVFLRLDQPGRHDDDLSNQRPGLLQANLAGKNAAGIEIGPDGLSVRGINPVFYQGRPAGITEVGLRLGQNLVDDLQSQVGGEWHLLIANRALRSGGSPRLPAPAGDELTAAALAELDLGLAATTMERPVFAPAEAYRRALQGETSLSTVRPSPDPAGGAAAFAGRQTFAVRSVPLRDLSGNVIGIVDIWTDQTAAMDGFALRLFAGIGIAAAGMAAGALLLVWSTRRLLSPIQQLNATAAAVANGDLQQRTQRQSLMRSERSTAIRRLSRVPLINRLLIDDEVEDLTASFNRMADQIETLVSGLEANVAVRTSQLERRSRQLQAAGDIAAAVAAAASSTGTASDDPNNRRDRLATLLDEAAEMIYQRFAFSFVGIYLLDERGEYAVLQAATGEAGRQLLRENYRLRVGQVGMVGAAAGSGRARVAMEVDQDSLYHYNPLLPETRSEAALPMRLGPAVVGVLDVQSEMPQAFQGGGEPQGGDITLLQSLADQLAIAIANARLIQELNRSLADLEQAHAELARQAWESHRRRLRNEAGALGYTARGGQLADAWSVSDLGLRQEAGDGAPAIETAGSVLDVPIVVRGQTIGTVQVQFDPQAGGSPPAAVTGLVEEVTGRLGLVLESARLLAEAQRLAEREQQINLITSQIRSAGSLDAILQNTARSLGRALNASRTVIQIDPGSAGAAPGTAQTQEGA